ncbi:MAG: TrkA C-terminal domain-containing protein, partial [Chloroflexota bacterium]
NVLGITVAALIIISSAVYILTGFIPFTADLPTTARIAVAILGGTILLALSPASTIAVIQEVRARGPFTKTILSVTVVMDVVIIVLFAMSTALASALLFDQPLNLGFLGLLALDLSVAVLAGYLVGRLLQFTLGQRIPAWAKIGLVLAVGYGVFYGGHELSSYTKENLPFQIHAEPLLTAMIAGFYVTNFTRFRDEFEHLLRDVSPFVYVAFFTLTGIALKLDILLASIGFAVILFAVRAFSIFVGSFAGGTLAGEPMQFRRTAWLALITQAGIALGLAREVAVQFPDTLGTDFATLIVAVVVLNEVFGPIFLKTALRRVDETHEPKTMEEDEIRNAAILGIEQQTIALARELTSNNWKVTMGDTDESHVKRVQQHDFEFEILDQCLPSISEDCLGMLIQPGTDAFVAMLESDEANYAACEIAYERFGVRRIVSRLDDMRLRDKFSELGVMVVDPASAMVSLLDQAVRTPQASALMRHADPRNDVRQVTVNSDDVVGVLLRDLRLPTDTLVLNIARNGDSIVPHGYARIERGDEVTLVGPPDSLEKATLRLGY